MGKKRPLSKIPAAELAEGIASDTETLLRQHFELLRADIQEEIGQAKAAALSASVGAGLLTLAGLSSTHMAAHLLQRLTRLPLWGSYGVVAGLLGVTGYRALARARNDVSEMKMPLRQTAAVLHEDLAWLQGQ